MKKKEKQTQPQPKHAFEMPDGEELSVDGPGPYRNGFAKVGNRIKPSPGRLDEQHALASEEEGVDALIKTVMAFATEANRKIAVRRRKWWKDIARDLGLEDQPELAQRLILQSDWIFLRPEPEPEPQPANNQS